MLKRDATRVVTTDQEIDAAIAGSNPEHALAAVGYDGASDAVTVRFTDGITASFPRRSLQGLEDGTPAQLAEVQIEQPLRLYWPTLDVALDVPGLLGGILGTKRWLAENGRRGGSAKTPAKINGAKGGRPAAAKKPIGEALTGKGQSNVPVVLKDTTIGRRLNYDGTVDDESIYIPIDGETIGISKRAVRQLIDSASDIAEIEAIR